MSTGEAQAAAPQGALTVEIVPLPRSDVYVYGEAEPPILLLNATWWRGLTLSERYAVLAAVAQTPEQSSAMLPPIRWQGWGRQLGAMGLATLVAALPPATWQSLVHWSG